MKKDRYDGICLICETKGIKVELSMEDGTNDTTLISWRFIVLFVLQLCDFINCDQISSEIERVIHVKVGSTKCSKQRENFA